MLEQLINFLQSELGIPADAISLGLKRETSEPHTLSIILWQYGLLSTIQLNQVFDWLEIFQIQNYES